MTRTEAQTRSELIERALSGWKVKYPTQVIEEFDILNPLPMGVAEPRTARRLSRQIAAWIAPFQTAGGAR